MCSEIRKKEDGLLGTLPPCNTWNAPQEGFREAILWSNAVAMEVCLGSWAIAYKERLEDALGLPRAPLSEFPALCANCAQVPEKEKEAVR